MKNELLLAALGLSSITACDGKSDVGENNPAPQGPQAHAVPANVKVPDLDALLQEVSEKPVPKELSMGAMCYKVAMPPDRVEYVCPTCGAKTLHVTRKGEGAFDWTAPSQSIRAYRAYVHQLIRLGLDIKLDESCLCDTCKKEGVNALAVEVTYKGKKTGIALQGIDDLRKLLALVEGRLVWKGSHDGEHPLKPELPRIRELLGIN